MTEDSFAATLKIIQPPKWLVERYGEDRKLSDFFMIPLLIHDAINNNSLASVYITKQTHFGRDTVRVCVNVLNDKLVTFERYFSTFYNLGVFQFIIAELERILQGTEHYYKMHCDDENKLVDEFINEMKSKYKSEKTVYVNAPVFNNTRSTKMQMTYIMIDEVLGYYKIGKSIDPMRRERTLQAERPVIKLIATTKEDIENTLHDKFKKKRVRGEWFNLTDIEVTKIIQQHNFQRA